MSAHVERHAQAFCRDCDFRRQATQGIALVNRAAYDHHLNTEHEVSVITEVRRDYRKRRQNKEKP